MQIKLRSLRLGIPERPAGRKREGYRIDTRDDCGYGDARQQLAMDKSCACPQLGCLACRLEHDLCFPKAGFRILQASQAFP